MKPRILDPEFQYTPSTEQGPDYLQRKFARIRKDLKAQEEARAAAAAETAVKVKILNRGTK